MPWSSQIFVGVPFKDINDARKFLKKYNILKEEESEDSDDEEIPPWEKLEGLVGLLKKEITIKNKVYKLTFDLQYGNTDYDDDNGMIIKSKSGKQICYSVLFGANLTNRYKPAVLDTDWENGRSDPFILDLEMLLEIRTKVNEFLPEAEIMLMDVFY